MTERSDASNPVVIANTETWNADTIATLFFIT
jgi:hypothetical protein